MIKKLVLLVSLLIGGIQAVHGQILLTVDVSDPSNVTFTGTGAFAGASVSGSAYPFPVQLVGFLTSTTSVGSSASLLDSLSSTLTATISGHTMAKGIFERGSVGATTFSLRSATAGLTEDFSTASSAFTGTATFDLDFISTYLPADGASGLIKTSNGTSIGTYSVVSAVPEPSAYGIVAGVACVGFVAWRKRKVQAAA